MDGSDPPRPNGHDQVVSNGGPPAAHPFNPLDYNLATKPLPKWLGAEYILKYLRTVEEFGGIYKMNGPQTIGMALYYAPEGERLLWRTRPSWEGDSWSKFKRDTLMLYPDVLKTLGKGIDGLSENYVPGPAYSRRFNESTLRDYYLSLLTMVEDLREAGHDAVYPLSETQIASSFVRGVGPEEDRAFLFSEVDKTPHVLSEPLHTYLFNKLFDRRVRQKQD